jgi:hypothetical protein
MASGIASHTNHKNFGNSSSETIIKILQRLLLSVLLLACYFGLQAQLKGDPQLRVAIESYMRQKLAPSPTAPRGWIRSCRRSMDASFLMCFLEMGSYEAWQVALHLSLLEKEIIAAPVNKMRNMEDVYPELVSKMQAQEMRYVWNRHRERFEVRPSGQYGISNGG